MENRNSGSSRSLRYPNDTEIFEKANQALKAFCEKTEGLESDKVNVDHL